jgi:hypothetical protein
MLSFSDNSREVKAQWCALTSRMDGGGLTRRLHIVGLVRWCTGSAVNGAPTGSIPVPTAARVFTTSDAGPDMSSHADLSDESAALVTQRDGFDSRDRLPSPLRLQVRSRDFQPRQTGSLPVGGARS